jgi:predicted CopG family antitoxin
MASKNISVTDDVYELLSKLKLKNESFSDTIRRLAKRRDLNEFAGAWQDMTQNEIQIINIGIKELREKSSQSLRDNYLEVR